MPSLGKVSLPVFIGAKRSLLDSELTVGFRLNLINVNVKDVAKRVSVRAEFLETQGTPGGPKKSIRRGEGGFPSTPSQRTLSKPA